MSRTIIANCITGQAALHVPVQQECETRSGIVIGEAHFNLPQKDDGYYHGCMLRVLIQNTIETRRRSKEDSRQDGRNEYIRHDRGDMLRGFRQTEYGRRQAARASSTRRVRLQGAGRMRDEGGE